MEHRVAELYVKLAKFSFNVKQTCSYDVGGDKVAFVRSYLAIVTDICHRECDFRGVSKREKEDLLAIFLLNVFEGCHLIGEESWLVSDVIRCRGSIDCNEESGRPQMTRLRCSQEAVSIGLATALLKVVVCF